MRLVTASCLSLPLLITLSGCTRAGAPSFTLFGAFFPAWMLCAAAGIIGAIASRVMFVATRLSDVLPYQLFVCTAIGVTIAVLVWLMLYQW